MTTQQNTLAAWLAQEDEQYQEYVKQRERRRIEWQSALDAANARADRAEREAARLREALDAVGQASLNLYARIALGITANRMRGNDDTADNDEKEYLAPWDLAWEQAKDALTTAADESEGA